MIPAYEDNEGLHFRLIDELHSFDKSSKIKSRFAGVVLKVNKDDRNVAFTVSDGSATAQVSLLYKKMKTETEIELPRKGDSVQIVGRGYRKVLGGTKNPFSFLKIIASSISKVTLEQQFSMNVQAGLGRRRRTKETVMIEKIEKLQPQCQLRTFESPQERQELRTLVMIYCYYVFEHNTDIESYIFNAEMIRCSKDGGQFLTDSRVTKACLDAAIQRTLVEMVGVGFLMERKMAEEGGKPFFVMKRDLLRGIEKTFEEKIVEMEEKGGVGIDMLTAHVNRKLSEFATTNFVLFDWRFSQKVLVKLQSLNKIYKTSDKLIFPNIRF